MILYSHTCILSIDVEDWFHLYGVGLQYQFKKIEVDNTPWESFVSHVDDNTRWILDVLDAYKVKGTFFILGWIAEKYPLLVKEIHKRGHELGSHSYYHQLIYNLSPEVFQNDLHRSVDIIQQLVGDKVYGFRASAASITDWSLDIILDEGLLYDSSLYPVSFHDVYGKLKGVDNNKTIEQLKNGLWEVKLSSLKLGSLLIPWSGGGYFRLYPFSLFKMGVKSILKKYGTYLFYVHPWELDENPIIDENLKLIYKLRRYVNIQKTRPRFINILKDFRFIPIIQKLREMKVDVTEK